MQILEALARVDRVLSLWMCHTSRSLQRVQVAIIDSAQYFSSLVWITYRVEAFLYRRIQVRATNLIPLLQTFAARPAEFFDHRVRALSFDSRCTLRGIQEIISKCPRTQELIISSGRDILSATTDDIRQGYFKALGTLSPTYLEIDGDAHIDYSRFNDVKFISLPLFQNVVTLVIPLINLDSSLISSLSSFPRLRYLKGAILAPSENLFDHLLPVFFHLTGGLPPSLELCVVTMYHSSLEVLISQPLLLQVGNGVMDARILLCLPLYDDREIAIVRTQGYRSLISQWCFEGPRAIDIVDKSDYGGVKDIWEQGKDILRLRREIKESK